MFDNEKLVFKEELQEKIVILAELLGVTPDVIYDAIRNWIAESTKIE
jgi:hypothetical protein